MTTKTEQQLVPLADLAGRLTTSGGEAQRLAEEQGGKVVADWSGRPCVPADVAQRAVDAYEQRYAEQVVARREYNAYVAQWHRERAEAGRHTYETTHRKAVERSYAAFTADGRSMVTGGFPGGPAELQEATEAQRAALEAHDRKHRLLSFEEWTKKARR